MHEIQLAPLTIALALVAASCGKDAAVRENDEPTPAKTTAAADSAPDASATTHAPDGFVPGSHEDWCGEHAVPESQCTRCNPALIPAFKATNDWCAEHGLPESQCLACNPGLEIERPPKSSGG